jgi:hypothetical protein
VLPVSEIVLPVADADVDVVVDDDVLGDGELEPQAAASSASGAMAAAVATKRILLATWEYSFTCAHFSVRLTTRTRVRATWCPR